MTVDTVCVTPPRPIADGGANTLSSTITIAERRYDIYFRCAQWPLADGCEPFLASALLPAMSLGAPLRLPGLVSQRLLDHMPSYQNTICSWYDGFQVVPIETSPRPAARSAAQHGVGCFFSAGVDSFSSVAAHREEITHLIFLRGFETPLHTIADDATVAAGVRAAAAALGKPLIEMETNVRDLLDAYADWGYQSHGAVLGAVALLLAPVLRKVYIPSSQAGSKLYFWGSHPMLDPQWSSDEVEVVHDVSPADRSAKVRHVAGDDLALRWLRVCSEAKPGAYNCGQCEKCLRTMVGLHVAGVLDRCATLPHSLDYDLIARLNLPYVKRYSFIHILNEIEGKPHYADLERALRQALQPFPTSDPVDEMATDAAFVTTLSQTQALQRELRRVYQSRSWRWTEPLRRAMRSLRGRASREP